jgi:hypothetical protein
MLSEEQRKYIVSKFLLPVTIFNFFFNGGIGYVAFRELSFVPLWGDTSIGADTIETSFFLPFFTYLFMTRIVSRHIKSGHVAPWAVAQQRYRVVEKWPRGVLVGAFLLALAYLAFTAPVAGALLQVLGPPTYSFAGAVLVKAAYSALLSLFVIPVIVALALRKQAQPQVLAVDAKET